MIFHLAAASEFEDPGSYRPSSLADEGFIHCSTAAQLIDVANGLYAGREDLLLVTIDPDELRAPVVYEDCYEAGERFPHIYGPIDDDAVISIQPFRPDDSGRFTWSHVATG